MSGPVPAGTVVRAVTASFLQAVARRDLDAVARTLGPDVRWANVPHPPAIGRDAVIDMLRSIVDRSEQVRWDVVTAAYTDEEAHLERVDRFWIGGVERAAPCHGVFRVDVASERIVEVRDYVDLGEWRAQLARPGT